MGLWTSTHAVTLIPAIIIMTAAAIILNRILGKKDFKIRMIPLQVIACLLIVLEIGKQAVSIARGYDLYHLPFHFCSLFIFVLPVMAFYNGKHKSTVREIGAAICAALVLLMLIYPNLIYGENNVKEFFTDYLSFHTVAFHNLCMFAFAVILALGLHGKELKPKPLQVSVFILIFGIVAAVMSQLLKTNYANMYTCNVPFFEDLRIKVGAIIGAAPTQVIYVSIVCILQIVFVLLAYGIYLFARRLIFAKKK